MREGPKSETNPIMSDGKKAIAMMIWMSALYRKGINIWDNTGNCPDRISSLLCSQRFATMDPNEPASFEVLEALFNHFDDLAELEERTLTEIIAQQDDAENEGPEHEREFQERKAYLATLYLLWEETKKLLEEFEDDEELKQKAEELQDVVEDFLLMHEKKPEDKTLTLGGEKSMDMILGELSPKCLEIGLKKQEVGLEITSEVQNSDGPLTINARSS
jgi:hypothetical protein